MCAHTAHTTVSGYSMYQGMAIPERARGGARMCTHTARGLLDDGVPAGINAIAA